MLFLLRTLEHVFMMINIHRNSLVASLLMGIISMTYAWADIRRFYWRTELFDQCEMDRYQAVIERNMKVCLYSDCVQLIAKSCMVYSYLRLQSYQVSDDVFQSMFVAMKALHLIIAEMVVLYDILTLD